MTDNPVLTREHARAITGGRTPLVPAEYESAVNALSACISLNEAKYWSDKADALAAWARIYQSDDAGRKARALKLHAYRRMGILAAELRPAGRHDESGKALPGPLSALMESGLRRSQATAARVVAKLPKRQFDKAVAADHPPAPTTFRITSGNQDLSDAWRTITGRSMNRTTTVNSMSGFACFCRNNNARQLARGLRKSELEQARQIAMSVDEWVDEFLQHLPRGK